MIEQSIYGDHQTRLQGKNRKMLLRTNQSKMALILLHLLPSKYQLELPCSSKCVDSEGEDEQSTPDLWI